MTEQIKKVMQIKGIKQKDLAEKLGISSVNLSQQFKRDNFRIKDLIKIAEILECEFTYNFGNNNTKRENNNESEMEILYKKLSKDDKAVIDIIFNKYKDKADTKSSNWKIG